MKSHLISLSIQNAWNIVFLKHPWQTIGHGKRKKGQTTLLTLLLMTLLSFPYFALAEQFIIPNTPLETRQNAKPMTMLVAGKDHSLFYEAYNDASDIDNDGAIDYKFKPSITYFGLFDPNLCYEHTGGHSNNGHFYPVSRTVNGKCPGKWSGNWLNYITTSRIDALRKVLYGGYREVDTENETILRRAYIPQDAHSWAKEYTSPAVDGYKISDYTPLSIPKQGKHHFFGNLTRNAYVNCSILNNCSNLPPVLSVVTNSSKRVWEWASSERPVLNVDPNKHGGSRTDYTVRVKVCTARYHDGCKKYPHGNYKPVGLLHEYGENESMLFGLLSGSYNKNMSGGILRKVISSFANEIDTHTGIYRDQASIVKSFDAIRIRGFNDGHTQNAYGPWPAGWVTTRPMDSGEFVDWGNPIAEMMYEGLRYFAGKKGATGTYDSEGWHDTEVGLPHATWDDPYAEDSAAKAPWCARANMLVVSNTNISFDSDEIPGSYFRSFSGDLAGFNAQSEANTITNHEPGTTGTHFIGQSENFYDSAPSPKTVNSLGRIRGLAPEEPTKQGSYYSASVAYFGQRSDLRNDLQGRQNVTTLAVALASPLPRIEVPLPGGTISLVPFAKSVGGCLGITPDKGSFQPTDQIVDFYVEEIANSGANNANPNINDGRYYVKFRINYEDVEQGADHDMDAVAVYEVKANANGTLTVNVTPTYESGCIRQNMGYIISGTTKDGVYLVVQDEDVDNPYFLNVPPGRDPGYCDPPTNKNECKKLPYRNQTSSRTFTPGSSNATLLQDPLWFAAKWGGFIDSNGDDLPDKRIEWDADNDDLPDTYFYVQNPLKLKESLKRSFDTILARIASAGSLTSNGELISTNSLIFQTSFNSAKWSGELKAFRVPTTGEVDINNPIWKGSEGIGAYQQRNISTIRDDNKQKVSFMWDQLSSIQQQALGNENILKYLRGDRSQEIQNGGTFRNRDSVLGDIVHSSPVYIENTQTVFVGANDGMLHAFDANNGQELFAYVPLAVYSQIKTVSDPNYNHKYFVDGEIAISNPEQTHKAYLVAALGRGGKGLFALDVTDPASFSTNNVLWDLTATDDDDMGYILGKPIFASVDGLGWRIITGNGINSTNGHAVLYLIDPETGTTITIDTGVGGSPAQDNGLSTPAVYDSDDDGDVDFIYAGDQLGNLWKFDLAKRQVALGGQPLFVAKKDSGQIQPINGAPLVAKNPQDGSIFVFFGTGRYLTADDPNDKTIQSWYGLLDSNTTIQDRSSLRKRTISALALQDGKLVRTISKATPNDMEGMQGWYVDLVTNNIAEGERMVGSQNLIQTFLGPVLMASSIIPEEDPCVPGGRGYLNAIDPFTGANLEFIFFDVNDDGKFDSMDQLNDLPIASIDLGVGMPTNPVCIGDHCFVSGSTGDLGKVHINIGGSGTPRRIGWREIINQ